jgi:hypothetical protein
MAAGSWPVLFAAGAAVSLVASWLLVSRLERLGERAGLPEVWLGLAAVVAGRIVFHRRVVLLAGLPGVWVAAVCLLAVTAVVPARMAACRAMCVLLAALVACRSSRSAASCWSVQRIQPCPVLSHHCVPVAGEPPVRSGWTVPVRLTRRPAELPPCHRES